MLLKQDFEKHLKDKRMSSSTLYSYINDLLRFESFYNSKGGGNIVDATKEDIASYYDALIHEGMSQSSVRRYRSSLNAYFSFLVSRGVLQSSPAKEVDMPKMREDKRADVLTRNEIQAILSYDYGDDEKGLRNRAIVELLYATGMKVSSLIAIKVSDYNSNLKAVSFDGRMIPLYKSANDSVKEYLQMSRPFLAGPEVDVLFVNMSGKAMTRQGLWKILCKISSDVGIEKQLTPRLLRRSLAVHMLENGAGPEDIEKILDLSCISSANTYVKLLRSKQGGKGYLKFHPMSGEKE